MSEYDENLARMRAEMDQLKEGVRGLAEATALYHQTLLDQGLGNYEALRLTVSWVKATCT